MTNPIVGLVGTLQQQLLQLFAQSVTFAEIVSDLFS